MNKFTKIALAASLLVGGIASTQACGLGAWDANTTTALAGGPADPVNVFVRYEGLCSMQTAGATPQVLNNGNNGATSGPNGEASMIARFYFLPGAATGTIFTTYSDNLATIPVYTVSYAGGNVTVTPAAGGGSPAVFAVGGTDWHSVEIKWASGDGIATAGAIDVWVDTDAATVPANVSTTSAVAATTIQAALLGGVANMGFDSYESRRTTSIGRILPGDAKAPMDGTIDVTDLQSVIDEILGVAFSTGMPNCNEDSTVSTDVQDLQCVVDVILGN